VVHSTKLKFVIFSPIRDALPQTRRLVNTWENGFSIKASQCSGQLYYIKLWTETFWANCSGALPWLPLLWHLSTHWRCSTTDHQALLTPGKLILLWKAVSILGFLSYTYSELTVVAQSADWLHLDTISPMEQTLQQTTRLFLPGKLVLISNDNQSAFWLCLMDQTMNYTFSGPTTVAQAHNADRLYLNTGRRSTADHTRRFHTSKTSSATYASQNDPQQTSSVPT